MARKYARDNRGRFASKGTGATARGGRLKTASGNKRKTQKISALSGDRMSSVPKGAIGKTRKQREITMIDRAQDKRVAYNQGRAKQQAAIAARKAPKPAAAKRINAKAPTNTVANNTGSSKTLNKFNSRPVGTLVPAKGSINLVPSNSRVPLRLNRESDRAFGRTATKAASVRAAAPAKAMQRQTTAQRSARASVNKQRTIVSIMGKGGRRPTPTRKQRRSLATAEAATRFYATGAVDTQRVNVKKPGYRLRRR